jgi:hypothetical protein
MITKELADLITTLASVRDTPSRDMRDRQWHALSAALRYLESLPGTGQDPTLLMPLRVLCAGLSPDLGNGRGDISSYTIKSAALGTVAALMAADEKAKVGAVRKTVAEVMTRAGEPTTFRTIRSWTEGERADQWREVTQGTLTGLEALCPEGESLGDFALKWLNHIVKAYR